MAASDYWNAFVQTAKRSSEENAAKQNATRAMVGASPINYDYNIIDFARDASPVGAAMNMGSALREGDYKTAGLNAALLGAEAFPPLKWGAKGINRLAGSPALKGVLHPAMWKQGQYAKDQAGDMWKTFQGKPVGPLSAGANIAPSLSEAQQINNLMKANRNKYDMDKFYSFVANKKPGPYYFHSSTRPDLTKDNFDYLSSKIDFDDAHRALFPKEATGRAGAFVTGDAANIRALRQQQGPYGPFKKHTNSYIFRVNPDKVSPKFQPMRKKYTSDPTVMEGFLPQESIIGIEKVMTPKNLEDYFRSIK